jgi:hypothetical protein
VQAFQQIFGFEPAVNDVTVHYVQCTFATCTKEATYAFIDSPTPLMCEEHKMAGMDVFIDGPDTTETDHPEQFYFEGSGAYIEGDIILNDEASAPSQMPVTVDVPSTQMDFEQTFTQLQLFPCCNHIADNIQARFKQGAAMRAAFKQAVYAFSHSEKDEHMQTVATISHECFNYLCSMDPSLVFRADAKFSRFGFYSNQPAECFNWVVLPARKVTRFALLKAIERWAITKASERLGFHEERLLRGHTLSPFASNIIVESAKFVPQYQVVRLGAHAFNVSTPRQEWNVQLDARTCTCRRFDDLGVPCVHALACITRLGEDPSQICHEVYRMQNIIDSYQAGAV